MEKKHIIATNDFYLEVHTLTEATRALLQQAADIFGDHITKEIPDSQQKIETAVQKKEEQPTNTTKRKGTYRLFDEDDLLARHHKVPVYKPIMNHILHHIGDKITSKQIQALIKEYYTEEIGKQLTKASLRSYASAYIQYLKDEHDFEMQKDGQSWKQQTIEEAQQKTHEPETTGPRRTDDKKFELAHTIYETVVNKMRTSAVTIDQICRETNLSKEEVERGISGLVQQNLVTQMPTHIQFRTV